MSTPPSEEETEKFLSRFKQIIFVSILLLAAPMLIYTYYVDRRLVSFEKNMKYRPPMQSELNTDARADYAPSEPVQGQVVYVPAYSHIYHQDGNPQLLTITLSIRNTSLDKEIDVHSVRYMNTHGQEVKSYLSKPIRLTALAATEFLVVREDASGGSGASFLVEWPAQATVPEPIIEAVMIDTTGQQGIAFVCQGRPVRELSPEDMADDEIGL